MPIKVRLDILRTGQKDLEQAEFEACPILPMMKPGRAPDSRSGLSRGNWLDRRTLPLATLPPKMTGNAKSELQTDGKPFWLVDRNIKKCLGIARMP